MDESNIECGEGEQEHVLLIEDDALTRLSLTRLLYSLGYEVSGARDGRQALALAAQEQFELVICDIVLPDRAGLELLRELRGKQPYVKVLFISGYDESRPSVQEVLAVPEPFLQKPFTAEELKDVLDRFKEEK